LVRLKGRKPSEGRGGFSYLLKVMLTRPVGETDLIVN
jgi:hypothetical protein